MDSRDMFRRRFNGKPGAKPPKRKVYCILEDEEYIYFPVAAQNSPYFLHDGKEVESYLAGMPNFFGGNMEGEESIEKALAREIKEESQGKIDLEIPAGTLGDPIFADPPGTARPGQDTYKFYVLNLRNCSSETFNWGDDNVIQLCQFEKIEGRSKDDCARYEDSFLVRMDKESFCGFISRLGNVLLDAVHELLGELGIDGDATTASIRNWYGSHTFTAFAGFAGFAESAVES